MKNGLCRICPREATFKLELRSVPVRGHATGGGIWYLCDAHESLTLALLEGRPVFQRGSVPDPLVDALQMLKDHQAGADMKLDQALDLLRWAVASTQAFNDDKRYDRDMQPRCIQADHALRVVREALKSKLS